MRQEFLGNKIVALVELGIHYESNKATAQLSGHSKLLRCLTTASLLGLDLCKRQWVCASTELEGHTAPPACKETEQEGRISNRSPIPAMS